MTKLVGILNITPDSFSDGGMNFAPQSALEALDKLFAEGADVVDIGAESTRPGATPLTADDEWERLAPVLSRLPEKAVISVDTRHEATARRALALGARWINDVSGFSDPAMVEAVRGADCLLVMMHSLSIPADRSVVMPEDADVIAALLAWGRARIAVLEAAGIVRERMIFDPGIGFGKTAAQSWEIVRRVQELYPLGVPVLIGHSRKSFLGENRDAATLNVSRELMEKGVHYLRVHDVAGHRL